MNLAHAQYLNLEAFGQALDYGSITIPTVIFILCSLTFRYLSFLSFKECVSSELQRFPTTSESLVGKATFLYCYHKARRQALKPLIVRAGWIGTGLWPISLRMSLSSRWVIQGKQPPKTKKRSKEDHDSFIRTPLSLSSA